LDRLEKLCIEMGMRMTEQRRVIARVLSLAHDHPDVEELHRRAHAIDPRISIATVYRTVRLFETAARVMKRPARCTTIISST
jgi:Fur family transcriptional regulator, ferric uptake regulator